MHQVVANVVSGIRGNDDRTSLSRILGEFLRLVRARRQVLGCFVAVPAASIDAIASAKTGANDLRFDISIAPESLW